MSWAAAAYVIGVTLNVAGSTHDAAVYAFADSSLRRLSIPADRLSVGLDWDGQHSPPPGYRASAVPGPATAADSWAHDFLGLTPSYVISDSALGASPGLQILGQRAYREFGVAGPRRLLTLYRVRAEPGC